jgi:general secretion pathway protein F
MLLFEHIELYVSSGLSIDKALETVAQGMKQNQAKQVMRAHHGILSGTSLATSLSSTVRIPPMIVGLIDHGEQSGGLAQSLAMARMLMEQQDDIRRKSLSALTYPVVIGAFAGILTIGLVRGVMPQIIPMLKSLRVDLPILTRIVMFISEHLIDYGLFIFAGIFAIALVALVLYRTTHVFKKIMHICIVHVPLIGNIIHTYSLSVFLRSCGTLIDSGISAVNAYTRASASVSLLTLASHMNSQAEQVSKGIPLGVILRNICRKTPYVSPLLLAGEASGNLGKSMVRAADIIDRDIDHKLKRATALIEPMMMAGMGIVVGAIALSIMMPIYDISKVLQR